MRKLFVIVVQLALVLALVACSGGAAQEGPAATIPPVGSQEDAGVVTAQGVVAPRQSVTLRAPAVAEIVEVAGTEGDPVAPDVVLVRLDPTDALLAIQQAEAGLAVAQAQLAQAEAGARTQQIAMLEAQLAAAEAAVAQAAAQRDERRAGLREAELIAAQAEIVAARSAYRQAEEGHDRTMQCFTVPTRDGGEEEICPGLGPTEETARLQMETAYAGLVAAQAHLDALQAGAAPQIDAVQAAIQAAVARRDTAQAQLELARAGSRAEEVALAEAGVQQAETALAQAQALLDLYTVEAPFAGTITDLPGDVGDVVASGDPLVTLATVDQPQIKTTDLGELDVMEIHVGQPAVVTLDAMPRRPLAARVVRVDRQGVDYLGDVVYPVTLELEEPPPDGLRWGMSAEVTIGSEAEPAPPEEVVGEPTGTVVAEATVEPERWSGLRFLVAGEVAAVHVAAGESVAAGDVLAELDADTAALAVAEAESALAIAQAELALALAEARPEEIATAEAARAAARGELGRAVALRDELAAGAAEAEHAAAQTAVESAETEVHQAQVALTRATDREDADAQTRAEEQLHAAELRLAAAEARRMALPDVSEARLRAANAGVWAAQAQVDAAQAELDLLRDGPTAEEIALAEAEVEQAEAELAAAEVALERRALRTPFAGTVTQVPVEVGDTVPAGQVVMVLADLDRLQIRTTDLMELDVVDVTVGEAATVTVDAMPQRSLSGRVVRVEQEGVVVQGDVTYPVIVALDEPVPDLLWGMTALVEIPRSID
jgi:multidrug resistance efflux pump